MSNEHAETIRHYILSMAGDIIRYRKIASDLMHEHGMDSRSYKEAWKTLKALEYSQSVLELSLL